MTKHELFMAFTGMFPNWADTAIGYKKIGSKTLAITFKGDVSTYSRVFLYNDPDNWQFGTKLWRKRPDRLEKGGKKHE